MKASRAYIAGLGTTGVLIASFLLLLMVGSAFVAFQGAPGQASNDGLDRLDVSEESRSALRSRAPLSGGDRASDASARGADRGRAGATRRAHIGAGSAAGAGGVEGERASGDLTGGAAGGAALEGSSSAAAAVEATAATESRGRRPPSRHLRGMARQAEVRDA